MIPLDVFGSEWFAGVTVLPVPAAVLTERSETADREFQQYLCKNCDRTFDDKTDTIFAH